MPRNGVSTNKINWFIWPARNEKFVWGGIGLVTLLLLFSLLGRDLNFVHPDSYISVYQRNSRRDWRKFFKNSLGTEKNCFSPRIAPLDLYRTRDLLLLFCQLWIIIIIKRKQICILFTRFHKIGEKSLRTLSGLKIGTFHFLKSCPNLRAQNREDTTSS